MSLSAAIPTRFDPAEENAITALKAQSGLSKSEIIRRAVRLLAKRYQEVGSVGFILDELAPRLAEESPVYGPKVTRAVKLARKKKTQAARKKTHAA